MTTTTTQQIIVTGTLTAKHKMAGHQPFREDEVSRKIEQLLAEAQRKAGRPLRIDDVSQAVSVSGTALSTNTTLYVTLILSPAS